MRPVVFAVSLAVLWALWPYIVSPVLRAVF